MQSIFLDFLDITKEISDCDEEQFSRSLGNHTSEEGKSVYLFGGVLGPQVWINNELDD
jgi:hypothetical protein